MLITDKTSLSVQIDDVRSQGLGNSIPRVMNEQRYGHAHPLDIDRELTAFDVATSKQCFLDTYLVCFPPLGGATLQIESAGTVPVESVVIK